MSTWRLVRIACVCVLAACIGAVLVGCGCGDEASEPAEPSPVGDVASVQDAVEHFVQVQATGDVDATTALMTEEARDAWAEGDVVRVASSHSVDDVVLSGEMATATVTWQLVRNEWSTGDVEEVDATHTELVEFSWTDEGGWLVSWCADGITAIEAPEEE